MNPRFVRAFALVVDPGDTLGLLIKIGAWAAPTLASCAVHERVLAIRDRILRRHYPDTTRSLGWHGTQATAFGGPPSTRARLQEAISILRDFLPVHQSNSPRFKEQLASLS